jgi:hypothetical protein
MTITAKAKSKFYQNLFLKPNHLKQKAELHKLPHKLSYEVEFCDWSAKAVFGLLIRQPGQLDLHHHPSINGEYLKEGKFGLAEHWTREKKGKDRWSDNWRTKWDSKVNTGLTRHCEPWCP